MCNLFQYPSSLETIILHNLKLTNQNLVDILSNLKYAHHSLDIDFGTNEITVEGFNQLINFMK